MKKLISILLSTLLILPLIASFGITSAAQSQEEYYADLFAQRAEYIAKYPEFPGDDFAAAINTFRSETRLTILLYTDIAKTLTFKKVTYLDKSDPYLEPAERWFSSYANYNADYPDGGYYLTSPEIDKAINAYVNTYGKVVRREDSSHLRACIEYFGITKEELMEANRLMQENPDVIREILGFLSDSEYELARKENGMFCTRPIPDFAMEALYLEDDVVANNLLCQKWAVYFGDHLNRTVTSWEIKVGYLIQVDELATCDLTPDWVGNFIERYLNYDNMPALQDAREAQLAAAETGDSAVQGVIVLALAIPALAATLILRRKKKI